MIPKIATRKEPLMELSENLVITRESWKNWKIVILSGQFVVKSFSHVRDHLRDVENAERMNVAIDLAGVAQIDSSALTVLLNLQRRLKEKGGILVILGPNANIKETLLLVGFDMAVPIYDSRDHFESAVSSDAGE
jgi:anti-anti-sigma factor